ncbi:hypothetical protein [Mangrovicoccus sp. HB161399]|uniref:DUF6950 family protein n=1 Tax=Mangrovicoccus sp. HB161399 TaxID=2720392 RepID=UPI0015527796|nr:hypothetical protein [Mangrovicoccus sp. HB161399]
MARDRFWPRLLADELAAWEGRPFSWGTADCFQLARSTARAMGLRPAALEGLPDYSDEAGAVAVMQHLGAVTFAGAVDAVWDRIPIALAQRGDWIMADAAGTTGCLGIVAGRRAVFMHPARGLSHINISQDWLAWAAR